MTKTMDCIVFPLQRILLSIVFVAWDHVYEAAAVQTAAAGFYKSDTNNLRRALF
jgi:hypothetical protein